MLQELIKHQVKQEGVGDTIDVAIGGKLSKKSDSRIKNKAHVKPISHGRCRQIGPIATGMRFDMGPTVGLLIGGVYVSVIRGRFQDHDGGQLCMVIFDPCDYRIVVIKAANHFRAW